ncbi:MAG: SHOCT domain-containing protein [Alphaproteobacteria bacterium]
MDSTVIAALISAVASVIVAIISSTSRKKEEIKSTHPPEIPKRNQRIWMMSSSVVLFLTVFSALFLHWDLAGLSMILVPLVILILSVAFPIRPSIAVAVTLFLFPFAFLAEPIGKWRQGIPFDNHFAVEAFGFYIAVAFGTSLIAWLITRWRTSFEEPTHETEELGKVSRSLSEQLSELDRLHREGGLSDDEFSRAKEKLLTQ